MEETTGDVLFNTNLPTKEERIKVRQMRIEARRVRADTESGQKGLLGKKEALENANKSKGAQQVSKSLSLLGDKKASGIETVTDVRVAADDRETTRRDAEEKSRQDRLQLLQEEAVASGKQNAAVEVRWAELLELKMPQELHREIEAQKAACAEIIASKDEVAHAFEKELKATDEAYVKSLKQQASDIEELLGSMRAEFKELQEQYEVELDTIEDAYLAERDELLSANRAEVEALFEKRREMELLYMDRKRENEEHYQQEIEGLLVRDAEEYNKLKIKLETDIQTLEQQLEEMRATYQLNTEKLEYNYRVLTERDNENSTTLAQLKRKQNKLKDALANVVAKYHETDSRDRKKNDELTEDYRRITKQYRDLQAKFRHFQVSDHQRFDAVWAMNEEEVNELVTKVLKADRVIHQQQLGWDWRPPDLTGLDELKKRASIGAEDATTAAELLTTFDEDAEAAETPAVSGSKLKAMVELLSQEAGFLMDPKVKAALSTMDEEEAELTRAESLLRAIGVRDDRDIAALTQKFFVVSNSKEDEEEDDEEDSSQLTKSSLISADAVISAIKSFVEESRRRKQQQQQQQGGGALSKHSTAQSSSEEAADQARRSAEEEEYWNRLADVVSDKTFEVWKQLETALAKYNNVIGQRSNEISKVKSLQHQNAKLKALLNQNLSAKVNDDLIVPPSATIRLPIH